MKRSLAAASLLVALSACCFGSIAILVTIAQRAGAPLLTMVRTAYDHAGRAVEYGSHVYRASLYSFELTLVAR